MYGPRCAPLAVPKRLGYVGWVGGWICLFIDKKCSLVYFDVCYGFYTTTTKNSFSSSSFPPSLPPPPPPLSSSSCVLAVFRSMQHTGALSHTEEAEAEHQHGALLKTGAVRLQGCMLASKMSAWKLTCQVGSESLTNSKLDRESPCKPASQFVKFFC